jgi:outer membrane protein, heavy metal efflux system
VASSIHRLVVVSRVRIDSAAGFVLEGDEQLLRSVDRHDIAGEQRTILGDHDRLSVAVFDLHGSAIEVVAVLLKDVGLHAVLHHCVGIPDLPTALLEGELKDDLPKLDARAAWEQLVAASPQIKSAEAERDHAHAELTLAEAQAIPNITLQAVAEYDRATQSSNVSTLVALPLPIFNRNQGNIYRAASDIRVACSEIERTTLVLRDLLAESFRRYQTSLKQAERFKNNILPDAEENLSLTEQGFKAGELGFLQVLTARQTYIEAQLTYVEALTEMHKVAAEIEGL